MSTKQKMSSSLYEKKRSIQRHAVGSGLMGHVFFSLVGRTWYVGRIPCRGADRAIRGLRNPPPQNKELLGSKTLVVKRPAVSKAM